MRTEFDCQVWPRANLPSGRLGDSKPTGVLSAGGGHISAGLFDKTKKTYEIICYKQLDNLSELLTIKPTVEPDSAKENNIERKHDMICKPCIGFIKSDSDDELIADCRSRTKSIGESPYFLTPPPSPALAIINTAVDNFEVAVEDAKKLGKDRTAHKATLRLIVEDLMFNLSLYVTTVANGNVEVIIAAGYTPQKTTRSTTGNQPIPTGLTVTRGDHKGSLDAFCNTQPGVRVYFFRIATTAAPTAILQTHSHSSADWTFTGLKPGEEYQVQVSAQGIGDPSDWSNPVIEICG